MLLFSAVNKLEQSVLKFYLIVAYTSNKTDKITEFFTKLSPELVSQSEWKEWFCKWQVKKNFLNTCPLNLSCFIFSFPVLQKPRGACSVCRLLHETVAGHVAHLAAQLPVHHLPVHAATDYSKG